MFWLCTVVSVVLELYHEGCEECQHLDDLGSSEVCATTELLGHEQQNNLSSLRAQPLACSHCHAHEELQKVVYVLRLSILIWLLLSPLSIEWRECQHLVVPRSSQV